MADQKRRPAANGDAYAEEIQGYAIMSEAGAVVAEAYREMSEGRAVEIETLRWLAQMAPPAPTPMPGPDAAELEALEIFAIAQQARAQIASLEEQLGSLSRALEQLESLAVAEIVADEEDAADDDDGDDTPAAAPMPSARARKGK